MTCFLRSLARKSSANSSLTSLSESVEADNKQRLRFRFVTIYFDRMNMESTFWLIIDVVDYASPRVQIVLSVVPACLKGTIQHFHSKRCQHNQCSGSWCFWASRILLSPSKNSRKTLIPTVLWLLLDFLSLKNDVNVPSKSNQQKFFLMSFLLASWRSMTKRAGSGSESISQRHGSADPDPHQNVIDPKHWTQPP